MKIDEASALIRIPLIEWNRPQSWCDLGSANGTFTLALARLLAPGSTIYAVDFDASALEAVLEQLKPLDPWMQMAFFTTPNERLDGKTPIEALQNGLVEDVAHAAGGYGEQGAL